MFLINWFKHTQTNESKSENIIIKRDDYEALIQRLNKLEEMMDNLPIEQPMRKPPIPPPMPNEIEYNGKDETKKKRDHEKTEEIEKKRDEMKQIEHNMQMYNIFQSELEKRLKMIRERMGTSHGFDECNLDNIDDLDKLEQTVLEKSIMIVGNPEITRSNSPFDITNSPVRKPSKRLRQMDSPKEPPPSPIVKIYDNYLFS